MTFTVANDFASYPLVHLKDDEHSSRMDSCGYGLPGRACNSS